MFGRSFRKLSLTLAFYTNIIFTIFIVVYLFATLPLKSIYNRLLRKVDCTLVCQLNNLTPKSLIQKYKVHMRSPEDEQRLNAKPLNWIDVKSVSFNTSLRHTKNCVNCIRQTNAILIVHSNANNFANRKRLRKTFFAEDFFHFFKLIFVVSTGIDNNWDNKTQQRIFDVRKKLALETQEFGDILQITNVVENYHNISHKARAWIKYIFNNNVYGTAKFIVKIDDDVSIDVKALQNLLKSFSNQKHIVLCRIFLNGQITRNPQSKWFLSSTEYRPNNLGLYCQGMAYVFSTDLLPQMYNNMQNVQYLWMDDWYVTHALMNNTRVAYFDIIQHIISTNNEEELSKFLRNSVVNPEFQPIFAHFRPAIIYTPKKRRKIWENIQNRFQLCVKEKRKKHL